MSTSPTAPTVTIDTTALLPQQSNATIEYTKATEILSVIIDPTSVVKNNGDYQATAETVKAAKAKRKFLDDERKISVTPLNTEVDRINAWYNPALKALKQIVDHGERLMANFVLAQKREEVRLLAEAAKAAQAVLATNPNPSTAIMQATSTHVEDAAKAAPPKVQGMSHKPVWAITIKDADKLVKARPDLAMPDMKKIQAWVADHGNKDVPEGVEVTEDVKFRGTR